MTAPCQEAPDDLPSTVPVAVATVEVPDAMLYYEVRGEGPLIVVVGAPMDASFFAPLTNRLATDHTVLTTDPRGINRSPVDDPDRDATPQMRADDLSRLLTHLGVGPAAVVGDAVGDLDDLGEGYDRRSIPSRTRPRIRASRSSADSPVFDAGPVRAAARCGWVPSLTARMRIVPCAAMKSSSRTPPPGRSFWA